jgi:hypothetical protein
MRKISAADLGFRIYGGVFFAVRPHDCVAGFSVASADGEQGARFYGRGGGFSMLRPLVRQF